MKPFRDQLLHIGVPKELVDRVIETVRINIPRPHATDDCDGGAWYYITSCPICKGQDPAGWKSTGDVSKITHKPNCPFVGWRVK